MTSQSETTAISMMRLPTGWLAISGMLGSINMDRAVVVETGCDGIIGATARLDVMGRATVKAEAPFSNATRVTKRVRSLFMLMIDRKMSRQRGGMTLFERIERGDTQKIRPQSERTRKRDDKSASRPSSILLTISVPKDDVAADWENSVRRWKGEGFRSSHCTLTATLRCRLGRCQEDSHSYRLVSA